MGRILPRATHTRIPRSVGAQEARSQEVRRLIGRALRAAIRLDRLGVRTLTVDCIVMTGDGRFVEVQGTAEGRPFDRLALDQLLNLAAYGIEQLLQHQPSVLDQAGIR